MRFLQFTFILIISLFLSGFMDTSMINSKETINSLPGISSPKDSLTFITDSIIRGIALTNHCRVISKITRPGQPSIYSGYDGRNKSKITDFNAPIEIGSCTKMFTATSILQLVEKGKLSLQSKLVDLFRNDTVFNGLCTINGKNYMDSITVLHLLNHTSGLPDYFIPDNDEAEIALHGDSSLRFTPNQLIAMAKKINKPNFIPGSNFKYTNTNYIILGMIIEKLTGLNYSQYIQQNILNPLNMKHTYFATQNPPANRAPGHFKGKATVMPATLAGAAGDIISDLDDMQTFITAWSNGSLFSKKATIVSVKKQYFQPMSGNLIKYGLGVINILDISFGHAGQTFGFQFYAGSTSNGSSFVFSIDDAAVSAWEPAIQLTGLLNEQK
jgi:D-alanyl-D-alanine carboxypeptidase